MDLTCPFCGREEEEASHLFIHCMKILPIWWETMSWMNIKSALPLKPKCHFLQHSYVQVDGIRVKRWQCDGNSEWGSLINVEIFYLVLFFFLSFYRFDWWWRMMIRSYAWVRAFKTLGFSKLRRRRWCFLIQLLLFVYFFFSF